MSNSVSTYLKRADLLGWFARAFVLSLILAVCLGLSVIVRNLFVQDVADNLLIVAFLIILVSMVVGLLLSEYPGGLEFAVMRLGFATFCRTGLPLLVVMLLVRYSSATFAGHAIGFLVVFYAVGLITSIGLSLYRFSGSSSSPSSQEVDSAAA
jgi:hypothetical protein